jgi:hypothetical protein
MEERNQQQGRSQKDQSQQTEQQGGQKDVAHQHKTGEDNPQSGSSWDNYQTRTLSGNNQKSSEERRDIL